MTSRTATPVAASSSVVQVATVPRTAMRPRATSFAISQSVMEAMARPRWDVRAPSANRVHRCMAGRARCVSARRLARPAAPGSCAGPHAWFGKTPYQLERPESPLVYVRRLILSRPPDSLTPAV